MNKAIEYLRKAYNGKKVSKWALYYSDALIEKGTTDSINEAKLVLNEPLLDETKVKKRIDRIAMLNVDSRHLK